MTDSTHATIVRGVIGVFGSELVAMNTMGSSFVASSYGFARKDMSACLQLLQVIRVAASRIAAGVVDMLSFFQGADVAQIAQAMGLVSDLVMLKLPITPAIDRAGPVPATIRFLFDLTQHNMKCFIRLAHTGKFYARQR